MKTQLERLELETARTRDHELPVDDASLRKLGFHHLHELRKVAIERLRVAALNQHLVPVAKNERAKAVPLRLENPVAARRELEGPFREHREEWRIDGKPHSPIV